MTEERIVNSWNYLRVRKMRANGITWRKIGKILAAERKRPRPYLGASVQNSYKSWSQHA